MLFRSNMVICVIFSETRLFAKYYFNTWLLIKKIRQEVGFVKSGFLQIATTPRVQQQPRQKQRVNQSKSDTPKRKFTKLNMPVASPATRVEVEFGHIEVSSSES